MRLTTTLGLLISVGLTSGCSLRTAAPRHIAYAPHAGATIPQGNSSASAAPCAQVEVAPGVFRSTDCERRPAMRTSAFAKRFQLPLRKTSKGLVPISRAQLPESVDLREQGLVGPIRDQGPVGVCWSMAMSGVADNALLRAGQRETAAPLHLIAQRAYRRLHEGGSSDALTREPIWRYDAKSACELIDYEDSCAATFGVTTGSWRSDPELVEEKRVADARPYLRLVDVEALHTTDELATALAQGREPYLALNIDYEYWGYKHVKGGVIQDYASKQLSHAVTLVAYRTSTHGRQFLVKNSWGTQWANGGYAWLEEHTLQRNFQDAFLFQVRDPNGALFPHGSTPNEPQQPTPPNACKAGQARDLMFGICMPACAGGKPSLGGLCVPQAPTASSASCGAGQARDPLSGQCVQPCPSGLLPVGGVCWLG